MPRKYAIVIALERYLRTSITSNPFVQKDAERFSAALCELGFESQDVQVLANDGATCSTVFRAVELTTRKLVAGDVLFFYYAGHGLARNGENRLTCYDTDLNDLEATSLGLKSLLDAFSRTDGGTSVCFIDACESGVLLTTPDMSRSVLTAFSSEQIKTLLAARGSLERHLFHRVPRRRGVLVEQQA